MNITGPYIILEYKGILLFDTISDLLLQLKGKTDILGETVNTYKRLLTITIEVLENSYRYLEKRKELKSWHEEYPSFIRIIKDGNVFKIEAGNLITLADKQIVSDRIDAVNSLSEIGLRDLYKNTISNGKFSETGGAGLGFIEIAKASRNKISYSFNQINQDIFYYTIVLNVKP